MNPQNLGLIHCLAFLSMEQVDTKLKNVSGLAVKLEVVKENHKQQAQVRWWYLECCKGFNFHTFVFQSIHLCTCVPLQLAKACQHVNQIFTVPESVKKTQTLVNEGKLLLAHKW